MNIKMTHEAQLLPRSTKVNKSKTMLKIGNQIDGFLNMLGNIMGFTI